MTPPDQSPSETGHATADRVADALRRRVRYAFRRFARRPNGTPVEAAMAWLLDASTAKGLPFAAGETSGCPGLTAASIETARTYGYSRLALRWVEWILDVQRPDGSFALVEGGAGSLSNTSHVARALLAIGCETPRVELAARRACKWLSQSIENTRRNDQPPLLTYLSPLLTAHQRWPERNWLIPARKYLSTYLKRPDQGPPNTSTLTCVEWAESLLELGYENLAAKMTQSLADRQRRNGSVTALAGAEWVSSRALAQLAALWYRLGENDRADRAMACLIRRQTPGGGFPGSWGPGAEDRPLAEVSWTAKHFLDAAVLQVQAAFEGDPVDVPELIEPADGRVQAVRRWVASLGPDARVADVGCGKGRFLKLLAEWFPEVRLTGIDISDSMLRRIPRGVAACQSSLLRIDAPDGTFDGAFAVESLEHSLLPEQAIGELCRIVRPGGRVLVIDKNRAKQSLSEHAPWERWFNPEELHDWLGRFCEQVAVEPVEHFEGRPGVDLFLCATGTRRLVEAPYYSRVVKPPCERPLGNNGE